MWVNRTISKLREEKAELENRVKELEKQLAETKKQLTSAKDPNPIEKCSFWRVSRLARQLFWEVKKVGRDWYLIWSGKWRKFKTLWDIWQILIEDNIYPSEVFEDKLCCKEPVPPIKKVKEKIEADTGFTREQIDKCKEAGLIGRYDLVGKNPILPLRAVAFLKSIGLWFDWQNVGAYATVECNFSERNQPKTPCYENNYSFDDLEDLESEYPF